MVCDILRDWRFAADVSIKFWGINKEIDFLLSMWALRWLHTCNSKTSAHLAV